MSSRQVQLFIGGDSQKILPHLLLSAADPDPMHPGVPRIIFEAEDPRISLVVGGRSHDPNLLCPIPFGRRFDFRRGGKIYASVTSHSIVPSKTGKGKLLNLTVEPAPVS